MVINRGSWVFAILVALPAISPQSVFGKEIEKIAPMLSFPASAGTVTALQAKVAYVSDGYQMGGCKIVETSGNETADVQACKTVSIYKALQPIVATSSVWVSPEFEGNFTPPYLKNPERVSRAYDYPSSSLRADHQGSTSIKLVINPAGDVTDCAVVQSSRYERLDQVSCRVQFRSSYIPAELDGEAIESIIYTVMIWTAGASPPKDITNEGNFLPEDQS
mgnify:FL=1|tara:strand:- start:18616 stop:19275 length:660 start_codon:yes stop_codon:yes gene_type:complete